MSYTLDKRVDGAFHDVVEQTIDALADEDFGILSDIDVQQTFAEKLDEEYRQYRILGACNPPLAKQALDEELQVGALLPCNVVVYETDDGEVGVSAVDAEVMLSVVENDDLDDIAAEVHERFERVLETLPAA
ncbi:DUF302 domain-containing protein [Halobacterium zhouii]|uniref:DUF302 domain-containing protein n=1 Tax=Halobacterium zhouii TaxID=2902624 RepID=UPI001E628E4C|nr:DUF302 domain-containing protein [Halobacterium zhouii]